MVTFHIDVHHIKLWYMYAAAVLPLPLLLDGPSVRFGLPGDVSSLSLCRSPSSLPFSGSSQPFFGCERWATASASTGWPWPRIATLLTMSR